MKATKYYFGMDKHQFRHFVLFLQRNKLKYESDAKTANQSEYTVLIALSDEDLLAIKLGTETRWIRKANW